MERVTLWLLAKENFSVKPMSQLQFAFRKGRSTETALQDHIKRAPSKKEVFRRGKKLFHSLIPTLSRQFGTQNVRNYVPYSNMALVY